MSELTSRMSTFDLHDDTDYGVSPSKGRHLHTKYKHGLEKLQQQQWHHLTLDTSDYSFNSTMSSGTPLKQRLQSLNLNTAAEFASRIPKRSPNASLSFSEANEKSTPSKLPRSFTKYKLGALKASTSMSRLPLPMKRHSMIATTNVTSSQIRAPILKAHQSLHQHHHQSPRSNHVPRERLRNHFVCKVFEPRLGKRIPRSVSTTPSLNPRTPEKGVLSYLSPTESSINRSIKKESKLYKGRRIIFSTSEPLEKRLRLSAFHQPSGSIEKTRDKRLAAIKEANDSLSTAATTYNGMSRSVNPAQSRIIQNRQRQEQAQAQARAQKKANQLKRYRQKSWRSPGNSHIREEIYWQGKTSTDSDLYSLLERDTKLHRLFQIYIDSLKQICPPESVCNSENLGSVRPDLYENLSVYEKGEVLKDTPIYFTGRGKDCKLRADTKSFKTNFGFDDDDKNYICISGDHIRYRYEVQEKMGKGTFGSVISALDHKTGRIVALKIVKNHMEWSLQAVNEVKFLKKFSEFGSANIIRYFDHFQFRSHMYIATEVLSVNLFQVIEATKFKGLGLILVRQFSVDILRGLKYIHNAGSIHCDLKPENLMLAFDTSKRDFYVKIIDFGSSCLGDKLTFSYLQSRYYRAPEVCLGARYNEKIDIWSFGAIVVELFVGMPIFQAQDEYALLDEFLNYFGPPSRDYIMSLRKEISEKGPISGWELCPDEGDKINYNTLLWRGFNNEGFINLHYLLKKSPKHRFRASTKTVKQFLMRHAEFDQHDTHKLIEIREFSKFLERCFSWNRNLRAGCDDLLEDRFLAVSNRL
ncbi:hypothetical protein FOA43_001432 [Brettanomyces nanus]|uniref:Protein kinase domain-containing protein n=1 Tax=Eeniella nana TaxID=13502 RepID=A0A875RNS3_EENNA|nr:uncharacterized protein FOA43_001432 [Brettanomyces nanus]QPG74110.1 hypothetical protein FOA43_001432 [Brettanomyces nanus]